jgi:uncharacterized protein YcsI (UPF0317 family)
MLTAVLSASDVPMLLALKILTSPNGVMIWSRKMSLFFFVWSHSQSVLMDSKIHITHSAGYMFVTDMPSDMGVA